MYIYFSIQEKYLLLGKHPLNCFCSSLFRCLKESWINIYLPVHMCLCYCWLIIYILQNTYFIKIILRWLLPYQKGWILFSSLHLLHNNCIICLFQLHFCCWRTPFHVTFIMKFDKWIKMLLGFIQNMILSTYLHTNQTINQHIEFLI